MQPSAPLFAIAMSLRQMFFTRSLATWLHAEASLAFTACLYEYKSFFWASLMVVVVVEVDVVSVVEVALTVAMDAVVVVGVSSLMHPAMIIAAMSKMLAFSI